VFPARAERSILMLADRLAVPVAAETMTSAGFVASISPAGSTR